MAAADLRYGMRMPSLIHLRAAAGAAFRRFPVVLIVTILATVAGIVLAQGEDEAVRYLLAALLGIPLLISANLASESGSGRRLGLRLVSLAIIGLLFWRWPAWSEQVRVLRYLQLSLAAHLLVAFLPYLRRNEPNGFWQYNRALLIRFVTAVLYSAVLFVGLVIALVAFDNLFGVDVDGEAYGTLFMLLAILFNTWFFLADLPADLPALEQETSYPKGLKVFSQHVLMPLVSVYLLMLTAYLGKVVITTTWPDGWIGLLVSSVAAVGILSLLLIHPVRDDPGNRWIGTYARGFWLAMIPSIIMLLLAIWKRIDQYGITEPRYILVILALWLAVMAVLFIVNRDQNILIIPATLCALALATVAGPWSAYDVSLRDQTSRLADLLRSNGMLVEGRIQAPDDAVGFEDRKEIGAVLTYLGRTHGMSSVLGWYGDSFPEADSVSVEPVKKWQAQSQAGRMLKGLGVDPVDPNMRFGDDPWFNYHVLPQEYQKAVVISGYDYAVEWHWGGGATGQFAVGADTLTIDLDAGNQTLRLGIARGPSVSLDLTELLSELQPGERHATSAAVPPELLRITAQTDGLRVLAVGRQLSGRISDGEPVFTAFDARYYIAYDPGEPAVQPTAP
ncbi:MAG: DUF4153 domain-containing protein [Gemmatimonadota bacterium]